MRTLAVDKMLFSKRLTPVDIVMCDIMGTISETMN